jgi:hypothetical protein
MHSILARSPEAMADNRSFSFIPLTIPPNHSTTLPSIPASIRTPLNI